MDHKTHFSPTQHGSKQGKLEQVQNQKGKKVGNQKKLEIKKSRK